jgi:hypothetical protein
MSKSAFIGALVLIMAVTASTQAQQPKRKKLLAIRMSAGYQHDSVSSGLATIWKIGQESGLWDTYIRTDTQTTHQEEAEHNAKDLDNFDAVMFYTTAELPIDDEQKAALMSFVNGKGFLCTAGALLANGRNTANGWRVFRRSSLVSEGPRQRRGSQFSGDQPFSAQL